jgi:Arc/MetJ-type ribon-helix-helix transcriptional regulator
MGAAKIAISIDKKILKTVDQLVERKVYSNRSRAISDALQEKIARLGRGRLAKECAKLDPKAEKALADEGLSSELRNWPKY